MKRYHIRIAIFALLVLVLVFPGAAFGQGGGDGDDDRGSVDGETGFSSGLSSPDLTHARGTGANGAWPEGLAPTREAPLASTTMVISEVWTGSIDGVELYNRSGGTVNIADWTVFIYDDLTGSSSVSYTFPSGTCNVPAGATVHIREDNIGTSSCATRTFYLNTNIFWPDIGTGSNGGVSLRNSIAQGNASIDFMRFGGNSFLSGSADWRGFNPMNANADNFQSLQRTSSGADDDYGDNWCVAGANMHSPNSISSCPNNYIKITEVDIDGVDGIEVYNGGTRNVNLVETILNFNDTTGANNVFNPDYVYNVEDMDLPAGNRVVFREDPSSTGIDTSTVQYMDGISILWSFGTFGNGWASIQEYGTTFDWHDLMWFGNVNLANHTYNPVVDISGQGLSRTAASSGASGYNARQGLKWCSQVKTMGSANVSCPAVAKIVINEFTPGVPDVVELYNAGGRAVNLRNAHIDFLQASVAPYGYDYTFTLPSVIMEPGRHIEIRELSGTDDFNTLYTNQNIDWVIGRGGAELRDNGNIVGDFVRMQDSVYSPIVTTQNGEMPYLMFQNRSHGRSPNGFDNNNASNFCEQGNSFTGVNSGCLAATPLVASATCNHPNLRITITSGDGPFNITASEGQNMPVLGVGTGTTVVAGPDRWRDVTVTETSGDNQSSVLETKIICRSTQDTILQWPPHRSHTTDTTPFFNWSDTTDANLYRIFIFDNKVAADRLVDIRQNNSISQWTASPPLPTKRLFWRARARVNSAWGFWSVRWTLFIDPIVAQEAISEGEDGYVVAGESEVKTPPPVVYSSELGVGIPNRDDTRATVPLPQEIPVDLTGLVAYEAEALTTSTLGAWAMHGDANASGSTIVISSGQPNDALVVNFVGDRFGVQYGTFPGGGNLSLVIDEMPMGVIKTDGANSFDLKMFGLSAGNHTARLYSTDGMISVDSIYVQGLVEPASDNVEVEEGGGDTGDGTAPQVQLPSTSMETEFQQPSALPSAPNSR